MSNKRLSNVTLKPFVHVGDKILWLTKCKIVTMKSIVNEKIAPSLQKKKTLIFMPKFLFYILDAEIIF